MIRENTKLEQRHQQKINTFGSQIRSYVLHPYKQCKDHITGMITTQVEDVLKGGLSLDQLLERARVHLSYQQSRQELQLILDRIKCHNSNIISNDDNRHTH